MKAVQREETLGKVRHPNKAAMSIAVVLVVAGVVCMMTVVGALVGLPALFVGIFVGVYAFMRGEPAPKPPS